MKGSDYYRTTCGKEVALSRSSRKEHVDGVTNKLSNSKLRYKISSILFVECMRGNGIVNHEKVTCNSDLLVHYNQAHTILYTIQETQQPTSP